MSGVGGNSGSSSSSKKRNDGMPDDDPYEVLGVSFEASEADITKAYRKLALRLHPDKHSSGNKGKHEMDRIAERFHKVQVSRSFLLDAEHASARQKYRQKRASEQARRKADEAAFAKMSHNRKRQREELKRREEEAVRHVRSKNKKSQGGVHSSSSKAKSSHTQKKDADDSDVIESLRRQGEQMREAYAERSSRSAATEAEYVNHQKSQKKKKLLEERQVRLKWSRRKMRTSPSEHSLAELLSQFGHVEAVEMIGSKGNSALITFAEAKSCTPCVKAYENSKEMRATYVGSNKNEQKRLQEAEEEQSSLHERNSTLRRSQQRDRENLQDWNIRREAEREQLLRQLEEEEEGRTGRKKPKATIQTPPYSPSVTFPPSFPDDMKGLSSLQKLERLEESILKDLLPPDTLQGMKVL